MIELCHDTGKRGKGSWQRSSDFRRGHSTAPCYRRNIRRPDSSNTWSALTGFELRKSFLNPWILALLAFLLALNAWKLWDSYQAKVYRWAEYEDVYETFYDRYAGTITVENIQDLMAIYGPLQAKRQDLSISYQYDPDAYTYSESIDESFFATLFYLELHYDYLYRNEAIDTVDRANQLIELYSSRGNAFKNRIIAAAFQGRSIPYFGDTRHYEVLLNHDYSAMLVLLLCLLGLSGVFVTEKETELDFGELSGYMAVTGGIMLLLLWYLWRKNSNVYLKSRRAWRRAAPCALLLCFGLLTGCSGGAAEGMVYNSTSNGLYANERYTVITDGFFSPALIDQHTGTRYDLPLDAHGGTTVFAGDSLYGANNQLSDIHGDTPELSGLYPRRRRYPLFSGLYGRHTLSGG